MDFKAGIFLSLILAPQFLFALNTFQPGQVIKILNDKVYIQNLGLDHPLEKDEFVRIITNSKNRINIKIESVDQEIAIGDVDSIYIPPFAPVDKLTPGQVIQLGLQADSLGKKDGIEIRKGSYLLGLGKMYLKTWMFFAVGVIDTMVINEAARDSGGATTNPFTGASIPTKNLCNQKFQLASNFSNLYLILPKNYHEFFVFGSLGI